MINFKDFLQILFKIIIFLLIINEEVLCDNFPIVKLPQGKVQGTLLKNTDGVEYEAFLGIPYAKPPVGDLRFKEGVPITKWPGTFNATNYGSDCLQYSHFSYGTLGSEDCLFVNVFKPVDKTKNPQYDVVVSIHGGAFLFLAGKFFGPGKLINHDFIYVSMNYRLGPLGFMSTGDKVLPGNLGLKDQNLALKWVKNNIKYFNGNENKIVISGLSAGGVSVHYHMLSPRSKGLFHGAMSASGAGLDPWAFTEDVPKKTKILAQRLGCPTTDSEAIVKCLNTRPAEQIAAETAYFMGWLYSPFTPFGPTVEPEDSESPFLPRHPYDLIKDGQAAQVPWLVSFTTEEGLYPAAEFLDDAVLMKQLEDNWYEIAPHLLDYNYTVSSDKRNVVTDIITKYYLKDKKITEGVKELVQMIGDRLFGAGIVQSVLLQAATSDKEKAPIYLYHFGYRGFYSGSQALSHSETPTDHGVCHADDCGYVLDSPIFNMEQTEDDRKMGERMQNLWVSFARTGTPYFYENEPLPKVQDGEPGKPLKYLHIKSFNEATVENKDDLAEFYFWSTLPLNERLKLPRQIKQIQDEL